MTHSTNPDKYAACAHCGTRVTTAGRSPRDGKRYCMAPKCRAAKQRARYLAELASAGRLERMAPTECSNCGKALPMRLWRSGDELGRWCRSAKCRTDRNAARARDWSGSAVELDRVVKHQEGVIKFLGDVIMAHADDYQGFGLQHCADCGLTTAIPEWVHPNEVGEPCFGTLDGFEARPIGREGLSSAWPFARRYEEVAEEPDLD